MYQLNFRKQVKSHMGEDKVVEFSFFSVFQWRSFYRILFLIPQRKIRCLLEPKTRLKKWRERIQKLEKHMALQRIKEKYGLKWSKNLPLVR
jgi:hypothetical protein